MLKPTSVALYFFVFLRSISPASFIHYGNTHKKRTDNVPIVDVTNVSHQETKGKSVTLASVFTEQDLLCNL